jgi:hypothetical protein
MRSFYSHSSRERAIEHADDFRCYGQRKLFPPWHALTWACFIDPQEERNDAAFNYTYHSKFENVRA